MPNISKVSGDLGNRLCSTAASCGEWAARPIGHRRTFPKLEDLMFLLIRITAIALALLASDVAQAQTTGAAIMPVRDITGTGQTKPPSREASPTSRSNINRRSRNERAQDSIAKGICIGCNAK
jgi:hypothetical protein